VHRMDCEISLLLSTLQRQSGLDPNPVVPVRYTTFLVTCLKYFTIIAKV
jgi:hypothetical protein